MERLSHEEQQAAQEERSHRRAWKLEQFDADGDGKLTGEEKERAEAARKKHHKRHRHAPGHQPAVDHHDNAPQEP